MTVASSIARLFRIGSNGLAHVAIWVDPASGGGPGVPPPPPPPPPPAGDGHGHL